MKDRVVSQTGVAAFKRCPKSYQLSQLEGLNYERVPDYVNEGRDFHALAEAWGRARRDGTTIAEELKRMDREDVVHTDMVPVFDAWLKHRGFDGFAKMREILHVEEPVFTEVCVIGDTRWWLRTSFDIVYRAYDNWIVCRDYKSFAVRPTRDPDFDFQVRSYIAALMRKYGTHKVMFEYEQVRRTPPGQMTPGVKAGTVWKIEECYIPEPVVISQREAEDLWLDLVATVKTIAFTEETLGVFTRTGLTGSGPHLCSYDEGKKGCFMRHACRAELEGNLNEQTIELLNYKRREKRDEVPA